jgi:hypothetical protein
VAPLLQAIGGDEATAWQDRWRTALLEGQTRDGDDKGSWLDGFAGTFLRDNRLMCTVFAAMVLETPLVLDLSAVEQLEPDVAGVLAKFSGLLDLSGITDVSADEVPLPRSLMRTPAWRGDLRRVARLDAEAAKALAEFKGDMLVLSGLKTLDADTARALAAIGAWDGQLLSVTAFDSPDSVAIAKALASRKGPLVLPNLKRISPKTLSALIEKEDIDIPLIETLELIPEPDGSATDDFVIPERFRKR